MNDPILLVDANFLCYRAFHSMGALSHNDIQTGVVFGFVQEVVRLLDLFATERIAFCFDRGRSLRYELCPGYKSTRQKEREKQSKAEKRAYREMREQCDLLRKKYLPEMGFANVFSQTGFEADDVIASLVEGLRARESAILVSADKDLYQLLRPNVTLYNPSKGKPYTIQSLKAEFGISPKKWAKVKALAGCGTDDVPGIDGVGEKIAAQFIRGEIPTHWKIYAKIAEQADEMLARNLPIVRLPMEGTRTFELVENEVTTERWNEFADSLGMKSLRGKPPTGSRTAARGRTQRAAKKQRKGFDV